MSKENKEKISKIVAVEQVAGMSNLAPETVLKWVKQSEYIRRQATDGGAVKKASYNRAWLSSLRSLEEVVARQIRARRKQGLMASKSTYYG